MLKETVNKLGYRVVEVADDIVALVDGDRVQVNQLDALDPKDGYNYASIYFSEDQIIALAEHLKKGRA
jgi:hypothetical protein